MIPYRQQADDFFQPWALITVLMIVFIPLLIVTMIFANYLTQPQKVIFSPSDTAPNKPPACPPGW